MSFRLKARPLTRAAKRVWKLLCDGVSVGSYTDHCKRPFSAGDMLHDDAAQRRRVITVHEQDELTLEVTPPDVPPPEDPSVEPIRPT